jgi:hypothetical protein
MFSLFSHEKNTPFDLAAAKRELSAAIVAVKQITSAMPSSELIGLANILDIEDNPRNDEIDAQINRSELYKKMTLQAENILKHASQEKLDDLIPMEFIHEHPDILFHIIKNDCKTLFNRWVNHPKATLERAFDGITPLMLCTWYDRENFVEALLKKGVNADAKVEDCKAIDRVLGIAGKERLVELLKDDKERHTQDWLIKKMNELYVDPALRYADYSGVCHGYMNKAILDFLEEERDGQGLLLHFERFQKIVARIRQFRVRYFRERMVSVQEKRHQITQQIKSENLGAEKDAIQVKIEAKILDLMSEADRLDLDIPPFLEAIELFQRIRTHEELHYGIVQYQTGEAVFPLLESKSQQGKGGVVEAFRTTGAFIKASNDDDLETFFELLSDQFIASNLQFPIAIELSDSKHAVSVNFDPVLNHWYFVDANLEGDIKLANGADKFSELAQWVRHAFAGDEKSPLVLHATGYVTANHQESLKQAFVNFKTTSAYQHLFEVIPARMNRGHADQSWYSLASNLGDVDMVEWILSSERYKNSPKIAILKKDGVLWAQSIHAKRKLAGQYFHKDKARGDDVMTQLIALHREMQKWWVWDKNRKQLKIQFINDVLITAYKKNLAQTDDLKITQAFVDCYVRWTLNAQGGQEVFAGKNSRTQKLFEKMLPQARSELAKITVWFDKDRALYDKTVLLMNNLRQGTNKWYRSAKGREAKWAKHLYLTKVIEKAIELSKARNAVTGADNSFRNTVLREAFQQVHEDYQKEPALYDIVKQGVFSKRTKSLIEEALSPLESNAEPVSNGATSSPATVNPHARAGSGLFSAGKHDDPDAPVLNTPKETH